MKVTDSNGNQLNDGDAVTIIRSLRLKSPSGIIRRGTRVNKIRLTKDPMEIEGRIHKVHQVLKTQFLKKI